jgi:hypothetical protein
LHLLGLNKQPQDICRAGELIRRAAMYGRIAGQIGFARYATQGIFTYCNVPVEREEILGFLDAAAAGTNDYYKTTLIQMLRADVVGKIPASE